MKFTMLILAIVLSACENEPYNGPIHPMSGTWTKTDKSCSGPVGAEVCSAGALPAACSGITLINSAYIDKTGDSAAINGANERPFVVTRNDDGLFFANLGARLYAGGAIFTYATGCELEFQR